MYLCKLIRVIGPVFNNDMSEMTDIMHEIIQQLVNRCGYDSVVNYDCSKLWFSFRYGGMMLEVECNEDAVEKYSFTEIGDFDIDDFCNDAHIGSLYITDPVSIKDEPYTDYNMSWKMFQMVKFIKSLYPASIENYCVSDFLMDPYKMEGENLWYSYFIKIAEDYKQNKHFVSDIIDHLERVTPDVSTNGSMTEDVEITPRYDLRLVTTSTKVRRLGYFKLMLSLFKENLLYLEKPFLKKVSAVAAEHEEELLNYKNTKGIIKQTNTGGAAKPYVEVALGLNLINKVGSGYEQGKLGRAYNALQQESSNLFYLGIIDKAFFLEAILRNDYLYIFTLLEYAYTAQFPSYTDAKGVYQQMLLRNLHSMKEGANRVDSIKKLNFQMVERRIREWKKPDVYLEHVLMPRLNWLYDLELLVLRNNLSFELTQEGERLFSTICGWRDISDTVITDPAPYLDACFMKVFGDVYGMYCYKNASEAEIDNYLKSYLEESFRLFKTFAPNRVTFSVFANYAKWKLLKETGCTIDIDDIEKGFLKRYEDEYIFKYQKFYNDGYIQKTKQ